MTFGKRTRKAGGWILPAALGLAILAGAARTAPRPPQENDDWGAPDAAKKAKNPVTPTTANLAAAKADYAENCERCHGASGKGDGPSAFQYDPPPTNFTDAKALQGVSDGEMQWKISEGRLPMPSFKAILSEQKRWQLVNYVRNLSKPPASKR